MIKLSDGELRDYLPSTMKNDVDIICLSYALKKATERLFGYQKSAMTYNLIDNLPEQVLDVLAVEMRSIYYLDSMEIETKRKIIKNTLRWYAKAGTLGATKELASVMFGKGGISEWFEYGGRPFCFRPIISIEASQQEVNVFFKYLKVVKNTRSWLDSIIYSVIIDHRDLENIILRNILFKMQVPFWEALLLNSRKGYELVIGIKNNINFCIKEAMYVDKIYINIPSCFNVHEKICGAKALFMLGDFNFWRCKILNGTKRLDGTKLLNTRRRYDLILGVKNVIKFHIKQIMDTDKLYINISSCFNVPEKVCGVNVLFRLGDFNFLGICLYDLIPRTKNSIKFCIKESIDTACLNIGVKVYIEEKTGVAVAVKAAVNFLHGCHQITDGTGTVTKNRHIAVVKSETIENITITCRRNLHYLNGTKRLDGTRLVNAFYGKESI